MAQNRRTRRARRYAGSARRSDVSLVSQPSCPNGLQDAGDQNHAHGRSMVSEVLCGGAMMRTPARSCSRVPQSARGFWFVGQCHPTGSLGCEPSITRFVLSGECRARAASHWRSGACHRGTRSGFIAVYFKVRQRSPVMVGVKLTFTQEQAYIYRNTISSPIVDSQPSPCSLAGALSECVLRRHGRLPTIHRSQPHSPQGGAVISGRL